MTRHDLTRTQNHSRENIRTRGEVKLIPAIHRRRVLLALYEALRTHQRGGFAATSIGVGVLPVDLSAVYIAVETELRRGGARGKRAKTVSKSAPSVEQSLDRSASLQESKDFPP